MNIIKLRPHHVLDIISDYGHGQQFKQHEYGHALHVVADSIIADLDQNVEFIIGADEICKPCKHLLHDGECDDVLHQVYPPKQKQKYNDELDEKLFNYLGIPKNSIMTIRKYLEIVDELLPGIEMVCAHPGENLDLRLKGLERGLIRLGVREGN